MHSKEIRKKFVDFFKKKEHRIVPSSPLIPEDETVLLTTAGMQQFVPYLVGEKDVVMDFETKHLASLQKCFRTPDIEEIGDDTHHTFFEMLGNWSIGEDEKKGYFKQGAIDLSMEFFLEEIGLSKECLYVTVFKGEKGVPRDEEAVSIWEKHGFPRERIMEFGMEDNFWGPTAETGPCGPCSEIHYDRGERYGCGEKNCAPNCEKCNRFVELWNLVFMEYTKSEDGLYIKLPQRNVDTGIGFERLVSLMQGKDSAYETDLFWPVIRKTEELSSGRYGECKREFRIIADHVRGSVFLVADGVFPSNKEAGYALRRIIRRAVRYRMQLGMGSLREIADMFIKEYKEFYPELENADILPVIEKEEKEFEKALEKGLKELKKLEKAKGDDSKIGGRDAFYIYQTFGFPLEMIREELAKDGVLVDENEFEEEFRKHQEISKKGAEEKFGGLSKDAGEKEVRLHTATHLLHQSLREVLGSHVEQLGSDINSERLRFDFSHPRKVTGEELKKVEDLVNEKIKEDLPVKREEMSFQDAQKKGALAFFKEEYPEKVAVYSIRGFSREVCGGPHVKRTSDLGEFVIEKEESSGSGMRRIKAVLK